MKFVSNAGQQRVIDLLRPALAEGPQLDVLSPSYSLFAYAELMEDAAQVTQARLIVSPPPPPARVATGSRRFIDWYWRTGPKLAVWVTRYPVLKRCSHVGLNLMVALIRRTWKLKIGGER